MSGFHAKSPDLLENMILCEGDEVYIAMLIGCVVSMQNYVNYASCLPQSELASGMRKYGSQKISPQKVSENTQLAFFFPRLGVAEKYLIPSGRSNLTFELRFQLFFPEVQLFITQQSSCSRACTCFLSVNHFARKCLAFLCYLHSLAITVCFSNILKQLKEKLELLLPEYLFFPMRIKFWPPPF